MSGEIQVRVATTLSELRELEPEWNRLWARCPQLTIFQSPDWLIPWVEVCAPWRLWVLKARRENTLVGLAPLFIYGTEGDRIAAPLGAGITDYLDVLIDPDVPQALDALIQFLWAHASEWTELHFPDVPGNSLLLQHNFPGEFDLQDSDRDSSRQRECDRQLNICEFCPQLNLPASIDELKTVVPAKQLRNLRAARRQLEGQVELATPATLDELLTTLFRLHEKRWQLEGEAGMSSEPRVQELHRQVAPRLLDRGVLRLFGLRHGGKLIACLMAFFERDVARLYMQGYDPEYARGSPGAQLVGAALEQAIIEKRRTIDFMRGRERYKYYWGSRDVPTFQLRVDSRRHMRAGMPEESAA